MVLLYPTACGPENCDEPIGECDDEDNDVPNECLLDCPGVEQVNPEEGGMEFCDWVLTIAAPTGCFEDCEQELLDEIEEIMIICDECLTDGTCDDYFDDEEDDCSTLSLDECRETNGCEPNFNAAGEFEGCYESNNIDEGCMSETGEFYCVGCEWFVGDCDYYECTSNGWEGPFTQDECGEDDGGAGDGEWLDCSSFGYQECMSNPDCDWYMSNNMDVGYCDDADNDEVEAQLYLADSQALAGNNVTIPMFLTSDQFVGGVQFTIATTMTDSMSFATPIGIESMFDCFTANFNDINGQFLGIIFSLEGCSFEPGENHIANIEYYISPNASNGTQIDLYFAQTIVSDSTGNEIPSVGIDAVISLGSVGDANGDGEVNVLDAVVMVNFALYLNEPTNLRVLGFRYKSRWIN